MADTLLFRVENGVGWIVLNRPEARNAMNAEMRQAYLDALARCAEDAEIRAVVLTGTGKGFCTGADLSGSQAASGAPASPPASSGPGVGMGFSTTAVLPTSVMTKARIVSATGRSFASSVGPEPTAVDPAHDSRTGSMTCRLAHRRRHVPPIRVRHLGIR